MEPIGTAGESGSTWRGWAALAVAVAALGLVVVGVLAFWVASSPNDPGIADTLRYEVSSEGNPPDAAEVAATAAVLDTRLTGTGAIVRVEGNGIAIDIPIGIAADRETIREVAAPVGRVALVPLGEHAADAGEILDSDEFPELMGGDLISAAPSTSQFAGRTLLLTLDPSVAGLFADYTRQHVGEYVALTLDGKVLSAPVIQDAIPAGQVEIMMNSAGGFEAADLDRIVRIINGGPLPHALREVTD